MKVTASTPKHSLRMGAPKHIPTRPWKPESGCSSFSELFNHSFGFEVVEHISLKQGSLLGGVKVQLRMPPSMGGSTPHAGGGAERLLDSASSVLKGRDRCFRGTQRALQSTLFFF